MLNDPFEMLARMKSTTLPTIRIRKKLLFHFMHHISCTIYIIYVTRTLTFNTNERKKQIATRQSYCHNSHVSSIREKEITAKYSID